MMRFLVVFLILFTMYWTWSWVHAPERDKTFFVHGALKSKIQEMLGEAILAQRPHARAIKFLSFWTDARSPSEVHLFFTYRFIDILADRESHTGQGPHSQDPQNLHSQDPQEAGESSMESSMEISMGEGSAKGAGPVHQEISGKALLFLKNKTPEKQNWLLNKIITTSDKITFTREIEINSRF